MILRECYAEAKGGERRRKGEYSEEKIHPGTDLRGSMRKEHPDVRNGCHMDV